MMKEGVIITKIRIRRQGERKHFQIKLPKDTKYIIGIEYGQRLKPLEVLHDSMMLEAEKPVRVSESGVDGRSKQLFQRNQLLGELKLQSCEEANWFFSADVFLNDANLSWGDFSQLGFEINEFTHGNKRTEEIVKIDADSTIIQGWYLDALGKSQKMDIHYEVSIYVWVNVEE